MNVLEVTNLGKSYRRYSSEWRRVLTWFGVPASPVEEHWVLRNINLSITRGETFGIVGRNGAGKSTLLKLIAGTERCTEGSVYFNGRISAILELGMGFNYEFTGRQNAQHALGLMGNSLGTIKRVMPEIEAFADVGEYFDRPLRTFSSGMQMRVAFAVATAIRPDIFIVDEVLSVGDAAFQRKCFQRIENFRTEGTSLFFVSHDVESVKRLCQRAVFLNQGRVMLVGDAKEVCNAYEKHLFGTTSSESKDEKTPGVRADFDPTLNASSIEIQYGDGGAEITSVALKSESNEILNVIPERQRFFVVYTVQFKRAVAGVIFGMMVKTAEGICIFGTNTHTWELPDKYGAGDSVDVQFSLEGNLIPGTYYLNVGSTHETKDGPVTMHRRVDCLIFRIVSLGEHWSIGYANLFASPNLHNVNKTGLKLT